MPDTPDLVDQVAREIAASAKTSPTPPGRDEAGARLHGARLHGAREHGAREHGARVEAINQVFALFRLNYHNQYYAAYPDAGQLNQIKKLWLDALADLPVEQILRGARHAIETSEYLPTLHRMLESCRESLSALGLPPTREAYLEACNAGSPKSAQAWTHPAVYLAGRDSDWFFLASTPEARALPVFRGHYEDYAARVLRGEALEIPEPEALDKPASRPLPREEQRARLRRLREETGI